MFWQIVDHNLPKRNILINAAFSAQFNYCPAIWRFLRCSLNNKTNRLYDQCLNMVCYDK